ncbi:glycosyl hydrolase [Nocardioides sp. C4-1]|uniref:glycosyl hydrolase n=1 Tax=Nocardioides sp. C4-1 TaxID=3151851 RepID=UPI00326674DF
MLLAGLVTSVPAGSAAIAPALSAPVQPALADDAITAAEFKNPDMDHRPATRWWWQAPLGLAESEREIRAIAAAGYGEVEIAFSAGAWADQAQRDNLRVVLETAESLGVEVSMTMGAAWPVQTPNTSVGTQYVQKELQYGYAEVTGGQTFDGPVPAAFDQPTLAKTNSRLVGVSVAKVLNRGPKVGILPEPRPRFGTPYIVPSRSTVLDQASMTDVTAQVVDGRLTWTAPDNGYWMVFSYWERDAAKPVTSAFNPDAARAATEDLDTLQIGPDNAELLKQVGDTMFEDSLELNADSLFWSQDFLEEFEAEFGYSMLPYLPLMYQHGMSRYWVPTVRPTPDFSLADGSNQKVLNDYYTFINSRYIARSEVFQDWAETYDMVYKTQPAFGQDLEPIRAAREFTRAGSAVEGESFNSGDRWPIDSGSWAWKEALDWQRVLTSGVHQGGANRVTTELGANRDITYELNLREYKEMMDKEWAAGFSKPVLHGFAYQSIGSTWPGKQRFGDNTSESWNDSFPQWADMKNLTDYWARGTQVLETGTPRTDVAIYRDDFLTTAARLATDDGTQPAELFNTRGLEKAGWSVQFVDPMGLAEDGVVGDGVLFPQGPSYRALVVDQRSISADSARAIAAAAKAGVKVVFVGDLPDRDTTFSSGATGDQQVRTAVAEAVASPNTARVETQGDVARALADLGAQPRASWSTGERVLTQVREVDGTTYVYLYNTSRADVDFSPAFEADGGVSRMDLASGQIVPADTWSTQAGRTVVPTHLDPLGTVVYAIDEDADQLHVVSSTNPDDEFVYRNGVISVKSPDEGTRTIVLSNGATKQLTLRPAKRTQANQGPLQWSLSVSAVTADGTYKTINAGLLNAYYPPYDWRDIATIKNESGIGTYTGTLTVPADWVGSGKGVELDLGRVEGTARIYVNDRFVGTQIDEDSPFDATPYLDAGVNAIKVEVRTTLRNAVTALKGTSARTQEYGLRGPTTWTPYAEAVVWDPATDSPVPTMVDSTVRVTAPPRSSYGQRPAVRVRVTAADGSTPAGVVTVSTPDRQVASEPVGPDGTALLRLAGLPVGTSRLSATFRGSSAVKASSTSFAITVAKATSRTKAKAKATGRKVRLSATVVAPPGARAGKVVVRDRGRWVGVTTTRANGKGTLVLRKVQPGRHRYVLTFQGNANARSSQDAIVVRVRG